jgi:hypothetical protein
MCAVEAGDEEACAGISRPSSHSLLGFWVLHLRQRGGFVFPEYLGLFWQMSSGRGYLN